MIKEIEGIIISTVDYKESSKIINIFTKTEGIVGIVARGSKRLKSNISASSSVLTYGIFHINTRSRGMGNLLEVDIINNFKNIKSNLLKINYACFLLELTSQVYRHDNDNSIYKLLIDGLNKINDGYDENVITSIIELKMLDYLGIRPVIDRCVSCGDSNIITISSYKGGYLCKNCIGNEKILNIKTLKLIRMFYYIDISKISKIDVSNDVMREINLFIDDYYDRYSGLYLKSKALLYDMKINNLT